MPDDFEDLTSRAGTIVGSEVAKMREQMGDEEFESYSRYIHGTRVANVDAIRAHSQLERFKGFGWLAAGVGVLVGASGAVVWLVR